MQRTPSASSSQYSASPPYYAANQPPITPNPPRQTRTDQIVQFNLELWDSDIYKDGLKSWRQASQASTGTVPLPMIIEFFLDVSELNKNQILVITDEISRRRRVDLHNLSGSNENGKSKNIMLERKRKLSDALKIDYRFVLPTSGIQDHIGIEGESRPTSIEFKFNPIDTPLGVLSLKVNYRTNCEFYVDDSSDALLSSKFIDMDENYFTPTMVRYYQLEEQEKLERRKSVPTQMETPPPGFLHPGSSPKHTNSQLIVDIPPIRTLSPSRSNPEIKEHSSGLTFPKIYTQPSSGTLGSNLSAPSLFYRSPDSRRGSHTLEPIMAMQPFKSPSLSSSPVNHHEIMPPSPTLYERTSTSPLHRSPSQLSFQQRSTTTRPVSIESGTIPAMSSSVKSTSSAGSPRNVMAASVVDDVQQLGSFFANPDDDVGEFVRMVDSREPLKMFSRSPTGSDDTGGSARNLSGSVYRTQLQLSRFQKLKESHKNLSESITGTGDDIITGSPSSGISLRVHQAKADDDDMFFTMSEFSDDKTNSAVNNVSGTDSRGGKPDPTNNKWEGRPKKEIGVDVLTLHVVLANRNCEC
ncbi:18085_t:CDS:10 [Racocetra fulgida]|uniref:Autophagy-related protein 13 n=1 Tax=Racocetra fulgida TaxID=60492 RepID=A0A9N8ZM64_9GLOM|nr:18085_t:CDS:10 [Racocetra fulgida]